MTERRVDMVRLPQAEEVYDVEEVLGRDARSVFPTQSKAAADTAIANSTEAIREMLGAKRFVTESELQSIKASRVGESDSVEPLKPLAEVLREAKEAKDAAFSDKWKQMKTGKNRPLDDDELDFLDSVAQAEADRLKAQMAAERQEVEEFKRAAAEAAASSIETFPAPVIKQDLVKPVAKTVIKPQIRVIKNKSQQDVMGDKVSTGPQSVAAQSSRAQHSTDAGTAEQQSDVNAPATKRHKAEEPLNDSEPASLGLMLGGYGSDDDDDGSEEG